MVVNNKELLTLAPLSSLAQLNYLDSPWMRPGTSELFRFFDKFKHVFTTRLLFEASSEQLAQLTGYFQHILQFISTENIFSIGIDPSKYRELLNLTPWISD